MDPGISTFMTDHLLYFLIFRFEDMNRLITTAKLHPVVDKVFAFNEAKEAYNYLKSQKHVGKVVINIAN